MYNQPDRPLVVKCVLDNRHKRISFTTARNCTYDLLKRRVEQCFALSSTPYTISYKDDDGEVTTILTDLDLTEAIEYFSNDEAPVSSGASILSNRSFGSRKLTMRVNIIIEYDGPSLSDTSSLASLDEYKGRNGSRQSFSFGSPSVDLEDDSVTVSSRDNGRLSTADSTVLSSPTSISAVRPTQAKPDIESGIRTLRLDDNPFTDDYSRSVQERYPADPAILFERSDSQKRQREDSIEVGYSSLERSERGAAWLRDQNERAIRTMLGTLPEPSESDAVSIEPRDTRRYKGDLALERDPNGRYYYTYNSASSAASQSNDEGYDDDSRGSIEHRLRPNSMQLNWLASQRVKADKHSKPVALGPAISTHSHPYQPIFGSSSNEENTFDLNESGLLHPYPSAPPPSELTGCSYCGTLLDTLRYVCSVCGEKTPAKAREQVDGYSHSHQHTYPPLVHSASSSPLMPTSPDPFFGWPGSQIRPRNNHGNPFSSSAPHLSPHGTSVTQGYELCPNCLESVGIDHAIEGGLSSPGLSLPASPSDAQAASQWRRAPPRKGQLRHAFREKLWGRNGWEDVEQDEAQVSKCSTCEAVTNSKRYKCASCGNINLCRACYSQVHELHPSHAFLTIPDKPIASFKPSERNGEQPLTHQGVKCAHCLLDIVGALFHCLVCDSVDICSNCESAGLPGNLDSDGGGHNSSHILIKIPYPLEDSELESVSRRAFSLWTGRDAASVGLGSFGSKASSVVSFAHTVVVRGSSHQSMGNHHIPCNGCRNSIIGNRYQCANCPSLPRGYNLCENCEHRSYMLHDPMHVFFKFPRPVHKPLELLSPLIPILYKQPVGPASGSTSQNDPRGYLSQLMHSAAVCDRCMTRIWGAWFRCAYCGRDLCDTCEDVDTHDDTHVFLVFKAPVDMHIFKNFINLDNPEGSPPVIKHPVYRLDA